MFFKYLVLVLLVIDFVQSASLPNACNSTVLPPDPDSGCCGIDASGGKNNPLKQFPWLALIEYKDAEDGSYQEVCNGALISGVFVLTAALCVSELDGPISVRLGEYDRSNEFQSKDCVNLEHKEQCNPGALRIPIESYWSHPMFQARKQKNDIALIKLAKTVYYTDYVRPLCLPSSDITINPPANLNLVVAGWGVIQHNDDSSKHIDNNIKRHINLPFWTSERCKVRWPTVNGDKQICAGGDGVSGCCLGDAGGPVMYENSGVYQAAGVVSLGGIRCATNNTPDVSTKVFAYRNWIKEVMEKNK